MGATRQGKAGTEMVVKEAAPLSRVLVRREIDYQGLWFALARGSWRTLVVVPAEEGGSATAVATGLADVGRRLRSAPVTFLVMAGPLDYASAGRVVSSMANGVDTAGEGEGPHPRIIIAIPPVISEPLGIAITDAADAVVLAIEPGKTTTPSARKTIELIGRDRIIGSVFT